MDAKPLRDLIKEEKVLQEKPKFYVGTHSRTYPKPLNLFRGTCCVSKLLPVAEHQVVLFAYKRAAIEEDCKFYAYWGFLLTTGEYEPLMEWHYHPSHKGIHCKVPCETTLSYTSRQLVNAPELSVCLGKRPDIRTDWGVQEMIGLFCGKLNIRLPETSQTALFEECSDEH